MNKRYDLKRDMDNDAMGDDRDYATPPSAQQQEGPRQLIAYQAELDAAYQRGWQEAIEAAARRVEQVVGGNWVSKFTKSVCAEIRSLRFSPTHSKDRYWRAL